MNLWYLSLRNFIDQSIIAYAQSLYSRSPADELWKEIEDEVFNSSQDYDGKVKIPSTFQEILTKLESAEVTRVFIFTFFN